MDCAGKKLKIGVLLTHPVQYYSPWFAKLSEQCELKVYYACRQTPEGQAAAGFETSFEWDVPLLEGYQWQYLKNVAHDPGLHHFGGCDTPEICEIIKEERFDAFLIFGWNKKCYLQGWFGALRAGTRVFIRIDSQLASQKSTILKPLKKFIYSLVLPRAAHYLSPGERTDQYLRYFSVPEKRIHRLAHMVDTARFRKAARNARTDGVCQEIRAKYGASDETFIFMFAGKLIEKKRPGLLIDAFSKLNADDVQLWIVGDGPLREQLKVVAETATLPIQFLGFVNQSELPAIYAAADCLVLPSDAAETWGLVVNEAFACGTPAIASSEAGCVPELIEDGETGWTLNKPIMERLTELLATAVEDTRALPIIALERKTNEGSYDVGVERFLKIATGKNGTTSNAAKNTV